ncbi:hypothetical protein DYB36_007686 [Aphanomyces astaci]|uniref:Uncharacterized protein n=1 Tax=Aphanomyces astaci TaxID=112090 RepID=A0A397FHH2_APHAT|nr:hypothetical protein DYB36_007686 [Aphanomyces astaci]RHZ21785.1 hypothetical protein DYB31_011983 [Aphanomyces astaci]
MSSTHSLSNLLKASGYRIRFLWRWFIILAEQYVPLDVPDEVDEFVTLDMRVGIVLVHCRSSCGVCNHFAEGNELTDDMLTLHDYGIDGGLTHEKEVVCLIYYDFKPTQHDNPLLLATEQY